MATPGKLISVVSEVFDIPEATVFQHDRMLIQAGFRHAAGRGRHANVEPVDAANLLISIMGAPAFGPSIKESASTVRKYQNLTAWTKGPYLKKGSWPRSMPNLPIGHGFRNALAEIITRFASGQFDTPLNIWPELKQTLSVESTSIGSADRHLAHEAFDPGALLIHVSIKSPHPYATIDISGWTSIPKTISQDEGLRYFQLPTQNRTFPDPGWGQERFISGAPLRQISEIFRRPDTPEHPTAAII